MKKMKKTGCLFLFLFGIFLGKAQTEIDYYFDVGGISTSKSTLKFNLFSPVNGAYSLSLERFLTKKIAVEGGISYLANYYVPEISNLKDFPNQAMSFDTKGGWGYVLQTKYYQPIHQSRIFKKYGGLMFRQRFYELTSMQERIHTDIGVIGGVYQDFGGRFIIDYCVGLAYRGYIYEYSLYDKAQQSNFIGILSIKIGIKI